MADQQKQQTKSLEDRPKREGILNLSQYENKLIRVKFTGGRLVVGILKGFDALMNLVLDEAIEYLRDPEDLAIITDKTRKLGMVVCRGTSVMTISPEDGTSEIPNPFV